jgi:cytochrome c556
MMKPSLTAAFAGAVLIALLAACSPPERDYEEERILQVKDLEELMYVQATVADRRFRLARRVDPQHVTKAQFAEFEDMGRRLRASAQVLPKFSRGPGFDAYAKQLDARSRELERAAKAQDGKAVVDLAGQIKQVCAACHDEFR